MQISTNGFITFESPAEVFHWSLLSALPVPLIAPLWAEFDFTSSGSVYYRTSQDRELLERVAAIVVHENPNLDDFHPILLIVVTWFRASFLSVTISQVIFFAIKLSNIYM